MEKRDRKRTSRRVAPGLWSPQSTQAEHGLQSRIDSPLFFRCEMPGEVAEPGYVDSPDVFHEYPCRCLIYFYRGSVRSGSGAR